MRPEVRARHAHALTRIRGDDAFLRRFERFFTELHDPLHAVYGRRSAVPGRMGRPAGRRSPPPLPRATRSCARSTTSARSPPTGCTASRPSATSRTSTASPGRCRASASGSPTCASSASPTCTSCRCCARARSPTTAATPSPTTARSSRRWGRWTTCASWRRTCARRACRCASTSSSTTPRASTRGRVAARRGDPGRLAFYRTFADRTEPDAYERTLPEVFPDTAPGNFTFDPELGRWVWTTFNDVPVGPRPREPRGVPSPWPTAMLELAAVGVDVLRLDAVPFLWKRMGTDCQNQPEVHDLLQAYRAVVRIAAPAVAFKAEAIVAPRDLVALPRRRPPRGHGVRPRVPQRPHGPAVEHARLAAGRAARRGRSRRCRRCPPGAGWLTYVRCHDDIGWAITDEDAGAVGEDAHLHRRFLTEFYSGVFPGSLRARRAVPARAAAARRGSAARRRRWPGSSSRWRRPTRSTRTSRCAGCSCSTPWRSRSAGSRSSTWATSSRCATTRPGPRTPRTRTTRAGCTARRWTGRPPPGARTGAPPRASCGRGCDGSSTRAAGARRCTGTASHGRWRRAIRTSSGCCASTRAGGCSSSRASASSVARSRSRCSPSMASRPVRSAGEPDGRPLRIDGGTLVLEPFQHVWCDG